MGKGMNDTELDKLLEEEMIRQRMSMYLKKKLKDLMPGS